MSLHAAGAAPRRDRRPVACTLGPVGFHEDFHVQPGGDRTDRRSKPEGPRRFLLPSRSRACPSVSPRFAIAYRFAADTVCVCVCKAVRVRADVLLSRTRPCCVRTMHKVYVTFHLFFFSFSHHVDSSGREILCNSSSDPWPWAFQARKHTHV